MNLLIDPRFARRLGAQRWRVAFALAAMLLAAFAAMRLHGQEVPDRGSLFPKAPAKRVDYPDFADPTEQTEEVKSAEPLTNEEREMLETLERQPVSRLIDLLNVYDRLDNRAMVDAIAEVILKRIPDQPDAMRVRKLVDETETVRKPAFLDQTAEQVLAGKRVEDPDAAESQARFLLAQHQPEKAAAILEKLRAQNFAHEAFPYLDTLASCYAELKRWDDAITAWEQIGKLQIFPALLRERAPDQVESLRLEKRIEEARLATNSDTQKALKAARVMLDEYPQQPAAIAFYMDALHYAGRDQEALAYIQKLQAEWPGPGAFPYLRLLAHSQMNLKKWELAAQAFGSMASDPIFDEEARSDARKGETTTTVAKVGEAAILEAEKGNADTARQMIADLEKQQPGNIEVAGYRAAVLARTGDREGGLQLLLDLKAKTPAGKLFPLQDALGDIYIERKEFDKARDAYNVLLADKVADWGLRRRAAEGLDNVRKAELLDVAYCALQDRHPVKAEAALGQLKSDFPDSKEETRLLEAEIALSRGHAMQARQELESIRRAMPPDKVFPADASLGEAQMQTGQWAQARESFQEVIRRAHVVEPGELQQATWEIRRAVEILRPGVDGSAGYKSDGDGHVTRVQAAYRGPWWGAWRAGVFARLDDARVKQPVAGLASDGTRSEAGVTVQRVLGPQLAVEGTLGATSGGDILYGARLGNFINSGTNWAVGFQGNARNMDSTRLEALDARENRIEAAFSSALPGPWNIDTALYTNWLHLGSEALGQGYGGSLLLDYVLQTETPSRPEFTVGWLAQYQRFTPKSAKARELFDGKTHQQGIQARVAKKVNDKIDLHAETNFFYALDESAFGYAVGTGGHYWFNDSASIYATARYTSEGRGASIEGGAFEAEIGASISF